MNKNPHDLLNELFKNLLLIQEPLVLVRAQLNALNAH